MEKRESSCTEIDHLTLVESDINIWLVAVIRLTTRERKLIFDSMHMLSHLWLQLPAAIRSFFSGVKAMKIRLLCCCVYVPQRIFLGTFKCLSRAQKDVLPHQGVPGTRCWRKCLTQWSKSLRFKALLVVSSRTDIK